MKYLSWEKVRTVKAGSDLSLLATGGILEEALLAAEKLEHEGFSVRVLSVSYSAAI